MQSHLKSFILLCEMDFRGEIKEEPVWLDATANTHDAYPGIAVDNDSVVKVESWASVIPKVENVALDPRTEDTMTVENIEVPCLMPVKQETKSELTDPGPLQENAFESSADIKDEIFIRHTVPHLQEENNVEQIAVSTKSSSNSCDFCCKKFNRQCNLKRHMQSHSATRQHCCSVCNREFTRRDHLKNHLLTHSIEKPYPCTVCNRTFAQQAHLKAHVLTHSGDRPYCCTICNSTFSFKCSLKTHMLIHTGEKPYHCSICSSAFSQKTNLQKHMVTHTKERRHQCKLCEKAFSQQCHLKRHLLSHFGIRPFKCSTCGNNCRTLSDLKRHESTHSRSGERTFRCLICGNTFRRSLDLINHENSHIESRSSSCLSSGLMLKTNGILKACTEVAPSEKR
ncbi:gastrula zinc finger protein XlCGF57.1 isoform X1 [Anabrus simplex]|uniref:gastrula zinc finger protein XlCGF57.1 isoform X1 n=3 Tax=Anabrus simplex TaxID=316456 RepID=UPI0035A2D2A2